MIVYRRTTIPSNQKDLLHFSAEVAKHLIGDVEPFFSKYSNDTALLFLCSGSTFNAILFCTGALKEDAWEVIAETISLLKLNARNHPSSEEARFMVNVVAPSFSKALVEKASFQGSEVHWIQWCSIRSKTNDALLVYPVENDKIPDPIENAEMDLTLAAPSFKGAESVPPLSTQEFIALARFGLDLRNSFKESSEISRN